MPSPRAYARDALAVLLWGHLAQGEARSRLRQTLFILRRALAGVNPPCLQVDGDTVVLNLAGIDVDAILFEELVAQGSPDSLEQAVGLYQGDFLQGLPGQGPHPSPFEEWLARERERLRELALEALAKLIDVQRMAGSPDRALATALRLLALDPLQEVAHRTAMRLYVQLGRRSAALRQYQACVDSLRRELDIEPEEETRQLYRNILRRRPVGAATEPGPRPPRGSAAAPPVDDHIPLIGRESETDRLHAWLAKASNGSSQVGLLVGATGAGKSRLVAELVRIAGPALVLQGHGHDGEQIVPFGLWIDAFRTARLLDDRALFAALDPLWRSELVRMLPQSDESEIGVAADPPAAGRLFEAIRQLVARLVTRSAVVVVLEDLHWADEMSLRFLQYLVRRASGWPLLVVATLREEELWDLPVLRQTLDSLADEPNVERLRIGPLSRPAAFRLVRALSRATSDPGALDRLSRQVWRVSEGNPFVIVETIRSLQQGVTFLGPGELPLADRVRQAIARRLDRLGEMARELAAVGAVVGRGFEFGLLHRAVERDEAATAAGVEELVRRQVWREVARGLDFVHERVRAVAYAELLGPRRRLLHRRVAEAIESHYSRELDPHLLALGIHYREGEVWDKSAAYFAQAGSRALGRAASAESVACFESALDAVNRLPETDDTLRRGIDIRTALRLPLSRVGRIARLDTVLEEAARMAIRLGDERREAVVAIGRSHHRYSIGDNERACEVGERAVTLARRSRDRELEGQASYYASLPLMALGRYRTAADPIRRLVDFFEDGSAGGGPAGWESGHALACSFLARCLAEIGEFPEALAFGERGLARAEKLENPFHVAVTCVGLGSAYLCKGDFSSAIGQLRRAQALVEAHDIGIFLPATGAFLGLALVRSEQKTEGLPLIDRAVRQARVMGIAASCAKFMAYLAEGYLVMGQVDEARRWAEDALQYARDHRESGHEALVLRLLGDVVAREDGAGSRRAAPALYREALALACKLEMRPLAALCHLSLGTLLAEDSGGEQGGDHLARAVEMLQQMDMKSWLKSATDYRSGQASC
jgi:DNA-binding SARP family transcriptional activator